MPLPNFLIIGAAKAGTTSLYEYLRQHPDIFMSSIKETEYFSSSGNGAPVRTRTRYERLFEGASGRPAIGEASPQYLNSAIAAQRIANDLPRARLIVSLRNPADRAYSSYLGRMLGGMERRGVEEAMQPGTYYFDTSLYYPRLREYFHRFPKKQIKVILYDDLAADASTVVCELHRFLGVEPHSPDVTTQHNRARVPRFIGPNELLCKSARVFRRFFPSFPATGIVARLQKPMLRAPEPLPTHIRQRLLEQFSDDIARTSDLLGRDLSHWVDPSPGATRG